jgi:16S rRNA (cytosine967-C5)-methyltransferase
VSFLISEIVAEVIRSASREKPADTALRETLKRMRDVPPFDAAEISHALFMYYRWQGWLTNETAMEVRIKRTRELAERFRQNPANIPAGELRARAVPDWTAEQIAVSDDWARSLQRPPLVWLRTKRGQGKALTKKLGECKPFGPGELADSLEYTGHKDLFRTPEFHAGEFELQDISSQAVGLICAPQPGQTWWDVCAGEGGKLLHLSELMENKGLIWASDRAAWRLQKLKRRTARAKVFNYRAALWDGGPKLPTKTKFDGVLVDAPCSGVGTWQRNPHARWTTTIEDVKELGALQQQLLSRAAALVKPGGKLVYSVCTLTKSETTEVADEFETRFKDFKPLPVAHPLSAASPVSARIWMWPQECGGNGMFVAVWEKSG